jgi:hypothetical protein
MELENTGTEEPNNEDNFDDIIYLPKRHFFLKSSGVGAAVLAVLGIAWGLSEIPKNWWELTYAGARQTTDIRPRTELSLRDGMQYDPAKVIGTSGTPAAAPTDAAAVQEENREVDAILRDHAPADLIGQRVEVKVPIKTDNSMVTYWVGPPDQSLLVVLHRDVRNGLARMASEPSAHAIAPVKVGDVATLSGTIQRVPHSEQTRFSWDLTAAQRKDVETRGIYLLADSLRMDDAKN